jgi:HEAT repeat protein
MENKRHALIIASSVYHDVDFGKLNAPDQDAEHLGRILHDESIGGFSVKTLVNEPSNRVMEEIESFFVDRDRDALLLLYFSGHGIKDQDGKLYLATTNTRRAILRSTAVSSNFITDVMNSSLSRQQILLLDCCYSGAFVRGMVTKGDSRIGTQEYFAGTGRVVLTASDAIQYSFEGDEIKGQGVRSIFTDQLIYGLETGDADLDGDGLVSLDELYEYLHERVVKQKPQQHPRKWTFGIDGKLFIARNVRLSQLALDIATPSPEGIQFERRVRRLIADLSVPEVPDRNRAAEELSRLGRDAIAAVPALVTTLLLDKDSGVRWMAALALGHVARPTHDVLHALTKCLESENDNLRGGCIETLGSFGPFARASVPALVGILRDDDDWYTRLRAIKTLARIGPDAREAVPLLIDALADHDSKLREDAARALGCIGPDAKSAIPALIDAMADGRARENSIRTLGRFGPEAAVAVPGLIEVLQDTKILPKEHGLAAQALGRIGPVAKAAIPFLVSMLRKSYQENKWFPSEEVLEALGGIVREEDKLALDAIAECLRDGGEVNRFLAANALAHIGSAAKVVVPSLLNALIDGNHLARMSAIFALGAIDPSDHTKAAVRSHLQSHPNEHILVRFAGAEILEVETISEFVPNLITLIKNNDDKKWRERLAATESLGRVGKSAQLAVPHLLATLWDDRYLWVRQGAFDSLKKITGSDQFLDERIPDWFGQ